MEFEENNITKNECGYTQEQKKHSTPGKHHSEETKRKMRLAWESRRLRGESEETRKRRSEAMKGRRFTEEHKRKIGEAHKGKVVSQETKNKIAASRKGKTYEELMGPEMAKELRARKSENTRGINNPMWDTKGEKCPFYGRKHTENTRQKIRDAQLGPKSHNWKGGTKLRWTRKASKRRGRGFILITDKNPYEEPVEYHHIHPDLPYVVPCPKRIHQMFSEGVNRDTHIKNINAMLGIIRIEV